MLNNHRYTVVIVKSKDNADEIIDYLDKQLYTINFLDVKIKRTEDLKFQTST